MEAIVRNRRYLYLKSHISKEYFTIEEIKRREPLVYFEHLGKYELGTKQKPPKNLVDHLFGTMDRQIYSDAVGQEETDLEEIEEEEYEAIAAEMIRVLKERFVAGLDPFDYTLIDNNEAYDDSDALNADIQQTYFEDESSDGQDSAIQATNLEYDY